VCPLVPTLEIFYKEFTSSGAFFTCFGQNILWGWEIILSEDSALLMLFVGVISAGFCLGRGFCSGKRFCAGKRFANANANITSSLRFAASQRACAPMVGNDRLLLTYLNYIKTFKQIKPLFLACTTK
jgi:hypothetical protein